MENITTRKVILSIIAGIFIIIVGQLGAQLIGSLLTLIKIPVFICNIIAGILYIIFSYLLTKLFCEKYLKAELSDLFITGLGIKIKWMVTAIVLPVLVTGCYIMFIAGQFHHNNMSINDIADMITGGLFFIALGAGVVEEMVFRGIIMNVLNKHCGKVVAVIVPSVLFGFVHILEMNFDLLSCIQVILAGSFVGIMFSLIALESKSIWNNAIVHAAWNFIICGGIMSIGTSADEYSLFSYVIETDIFAITGGEFGIESSVIAIAGYIIVSVIAYLGIAKHR